MDYNGEYSRKALPDDFPFGQSEEYQKEWQLVGGQHSDEWVVPPQVSGKMASNFWWPSREIHTIVHIGILWPRYVLLATLAIAGHLSIPWPL